MYMLLGLKGPVVKGSINMILSESCEKKQGFRKVLTTSIYDTAVAVNLLIFTS